MCVRYYDVLPIGQRHDVIIDTQCYFCTDVFSLRIQMSPLSLWLEVRDLPVLYGALLSIGVSSLQFIIMFHRRMSCIQTLRAASVPMGDTAGLCPVR
jgi:hypothetical protein